MHHNQIATDLMAGSKAASDAEYKALEAMLAFPATTPTELQIKLQRIFDRDITGWASWEQIQPALLADLRRLQGHPVSRAIAIAFVRWRAIHEVWHFDTDGDQNSEAHSEAYHALMATPCTTAGDFMAKAYVNLLGEHGSTLRGTAKADMTGNMWDVDISQADDDREHGEVWQRAAYADLDGSDLGRNLLAYGLPHFSAELWMERADAVGMRVSLIVQEDGSRVFGISEDHDSEDVPEFVHRERSRLQGIWAFDRSRTAELCDEIIREWPQLAFRATPVPSTPNSEKAA